MMRLLLIVAAGWFLVDALASHEARLSRLEDDDLDARRERASGTKRDVGDDGSPDAHSVTPEREQEAEQ